MAAVLDLYEDPIAATYKDVEGVIHKAVQRHIKNYGGDYEDLLAQANLIFMKIYKDFDPDKGMFGKRVRFIIEKRLVDSHRREWKVNPKDRRESNGEFYSPVDHYPQKSRFNIKNLMENISDDAKIAVNLALGIADEQKPDVTREVLIELLFSLGWSGQRVNDAVNEVRGALK